MAGTVRLSLACWDYDRTRGLRDGTVTASGIELVPVTLPVEETFFRMLKHREFDVAEMSLSSYVLSLFMDDPPFVAIPVFPSRVFRHGSIYVSRDGGVRSPADLRGRVVGVPEYQITAAVWIRGILAEHHGLPIDAVSYRTGGLHETGRVEKMGLDLPAHIRVEPIGPDQTLDRMLAGGELDAIYSARAPRSFDSVGNGPIRRLFDDPRAAEQSYFRTTGIFPIMHTIVIRREIYERDRWIARSLLDAFTLAKDRMYGELLETTALKYGLPWVAPEAEATMVLMGNDFWPYGVEPNRTALATFLGYSHDQGLARKVLQPEELFVPESLDQVRV